VDAQQEPAVARGALPLATAKPRVAGDHFPSSGRSFC
jgi:hypothetical protein